MAKAKPKSRSKGTLTIADLEFQVTRCEVVAFVDDRGALAWGVEIDTRRRAVRKESWAPSATCDVAFTTGAGTESWRTLAQRKVRIADPRRRDADPAAMLYVFEHNGIRKNELELGKPHGVELPLRWTGSCDVFFDDDYEADLAFEVKATATFAGILSGGDTEEEGRAELARLLDDSELRYRVDRYGAATFVPKAPRRCNVLKSRA